MLSIMLTRHNQSALAAVLPSTADSTGAVAHALEHRARPSRSARHARLDNIFIRPIWCGTCTADGVRWPALEAHLGARYRQFASTGRPRPDPCQLLQPRDRTLLSAAHMAEQLLGCVLGTAGRGHGSQGCVWAGRHSSPNFTPTRGIADSTASHALF